MLPYHYFLIKVINTFRQTDIIYKQKCPQMKGFKMRKRKFLFLASFSLRSPCVGNAQPVPIDALFSRIDMSACRLQIGLSVTLFLGSFVSIVPLSSCLRSLCLFCDIYLWFCVNILFTMYHWLLLLLTVLKLGTVHSL